MDDTAAAEYHSTRPNHSPGSLPRWVQSVLGMRRWTRCPAGGGKGAACAGGWVWVWGWVWLGAWGWFVGAVAGMLVSSSTLRNMSAASSSSSPAGVSLWVGEERGLCATFLFSCVRVEDADDVVVRAANVASGTSEIHTLWAYTATLASPVFLAYATRAAWMPRLAAPSPLGVPRSKPAAAAQSVPTKCLTAAYTAARRAGSEVRLREMRVRSAVSAPEGEDWASKVGSGRGGWVPPGVAFLSGAEAALGPGIAAVVGLPTGGAWLCVDFTFEQTCATWRCRDKVSNVTNNLLDVRGTGKRTSWTASTAAARTLTNSAPDTVHG